MQKGILYDLLKTLTSREKQAFLQFVQSPYFSARPEIVRLARRLLTPPQPETPAPRSKAAVFPEVFGAGRHYDDARLRKALEQLLRLLERFLVDRQREAESFDYRLRLARILAERRQHKRFRRLSEAPLPFPGSETDWTVEHFEQAAQWYQLLYDQHDAGQRGHDPDLYRQIIRCQNVVLLARRLRGACIFMSNQKEKENAGTEDPLPDWAGQHSEFTRIIELPLLQTLFAAYQALRNPRAPGHFQRFRDGLLQHPACFSVADRRELLLVAINFCSQRYNAGDTTLLDDQLDLYDYGLREGLLLENNWVSGYTFTNIGTLALIARRFEWLEQFIVKFGPKVEPRYRESTVAFNRARLCYMLKKYQPALDLLQRDIFDDVLLNLSAKTIQAKCFFELAEFDLLETHLEAMRKYIRRHKEVGYYGERYLNFTTMLRQIIRTPAHRRGALQAKIEAVAVLAEKDWLLGNN